MFAESLKKPEIKLVTVDLLCISILKIPPLYHLGVGILEQNKQPQIVQIGVLPLLFQNPRTDTIRRSQPTFP